MRVTVSARVQDGWTALMFASKHGLEAAAKLLVAKGVAKDAKTTVWLRSGTYCTRGA